MSAARAWLLQGILRREGVLAVDFFAGADALAASGDVTRKLEGALYRGVTMAERVAIEASCAAAERLRSAVSALADLPRLARLLVDAGKLPPYAMLVELAAHLPPAVRVAFEAGTHLPPLLCGRGCPAFASAAACGAACATQVTEGGSRRTLAGSFTGSGYTAVKWATTVSWADGALPPSRMVVCVHAEHVLHGRFLRIGGSPLLARLLNKKTAGWASRADEYLLFSPSGIGRYEVVWRDDAVLGSMGPVCRGR